MKKVTFVLLIVLVITNTVSGISELQPYKNSRKTYHALHHDLFIKVLAETIKNIRTIIICTDPDKREILHRINNKKIALLRNILKREKTALTHKNGFQPDPSKETQFECKRCDGKDPDCEFCGGDGYSWTPDDAVDCRLCEGTGIYEGGNCPGCDGFGAPDAYPNAPSLK